MKNKVYSSFSEVYKDLVVTGIKGYPMKVGTNEWILALCC